MNLSLPDEVLEYGTLAHQAFVGLGAVGLARDAERTPSIRADTVRPVVEQLGMTELAIGTDVGDALAAGQVCRAAGYVVLPYPLVPLLTSSLTDGLPVALVDPHLPRADHGDLFDAWLAVALGGEAWLARPEGGPLGSKLGPFVVELTLDRRVDCVPDQVRAMALALTSYHVVGTLEHALDLTRAHVLSRRQFGQPLASFQAIRFQLADAVGAVAGLAELAAFTLWHIVKKPSTCVVDALALQVYTLEVARSVMGTSHQLHGAIGFCDDHDLSVLSRHVRAPLWSVGGEGVVGQLLLRSIGSLGFDGVFPVQVEAAAGRGL
ncbi:MAG: acyl-CoA dehydrogenase family protein [Acidimicrobiales bacterium]